MTTALNRRNFLYTTSVTAALAASGGLSARLFAGSAPKKPHFKISLAEWSLHKLIKGGKLTNLDFAKTAKDEFGIEAIEYVSQLFADKKAGAKYIADVKKRADDNGVESLIIMVDREGLLGDPDDKKRALSVENHHKWVEAAHTLGCHSIRVNAGSNAKLPEEQQMELAADGLRKLTEFAADYNVNVIVENHGGMSSNGKWLAGVMQKVGHLRCGTLPDFGNFGIDRKAGVWYDFYQGVEELMPYAKAVSAKTYDFDDQREFVTIDSRWNKEIDYMKMMKIVMHAGYDGYVGIEYEGNKLDEIAGIKRSKQILDRVAHKLCLS